MNRVQLVFALQLLLLFILPFADASTVKKKDESLATVDFSSLNAIPGKMECGIRLTIKTADGTTFNRRASFDAPNKTVGWDVCARLLASFGDFGWNVQKKGDLLTITGFTRKGQHRPITEISITSENTFPLDFVPQITTVGRVKVQRQTEPRTK